MGRGNNVGNQDMFRVDPGWYEYDGMAMTSHTPPLALDKAKEFEFHDDDVLCACYPKTGQTWMLSLLYMMKHAEEMEAGIPLTSSREMDIPFMELEWPVGSGLLVIDDLSNRPPPRYIKTHLPVHFFKDQLRNKKTKVIQVIRNPKDTLVSYYHFHRANEALGNFEGTWSDFFEMVRSNDHITWGDMFEHTLGWWNLAQEREDNIVFAYEDMKKDLKGSVERLAKFLGKKLSDRVIDQIVHKATFSNMKKDKDLKIQQDIDEVVPAEDNKKTTSNLLQVPQSPTIPSPPTGHPTGGLRQNKSSINLVAQNKPVAENNEGRGMKRVASAPSCLIWSRNSAKEKVAPFMRSGAVGDWRRHFNEEQSEFVDQRVKEVLEPVGLTFTYVM